MDLYYFDTDALSWRYVDSSDVRLEAPGKCVTAKVNTILEDKKNECYISEFVLLEWTSVLGKRVRREEEGFRSFDYEWSRQNEQALMMDIICKRLKILPSIPRIVARARVLVDRIGVFSKRALITVDAVHLIYAIEVAQSENCEVRFVSCDKGLLGIVKDFRPISRFLKPHRPY